MKKNPYNLIIKNYAIFRPHISRETRLPGKNEENINVSSSSYTFHVGAL